MDMLYGALGALIVVGLLALGAFAGWKARGRFYGFTAEPPAAAEVRRMHEEQEAFRSLQNYSAEIAYGLRATEQELERSEQA